MNKIPLARPHFDAAEVEAVKDCLESGWVTQGPRVKAFEERFAELHRVEHALASNSCTSSLHLAALALGLGPGDEAVVPAFTWVTSANCVEYTGARAVFADVDPATYNLDPQALEAALTPRTKAVVVVHLFGLSADMEPILAIARKHGLKVIEDAACAVGCHYAGQPVGGLGDVGCFSFHPRKIISTGEGGMTTTRNKELAGLIHSLRSHGGLPPLGETGPHVMERFVHLGYNFRLSDIQGAIGLAQLDKLEGLLAERQGWAERYSEILGQIPEIAVPVKPEKAGHTYQSYVIRLRGAAAQGRNRVMADLAEQGIWTRPGTHAVHRLDYYREKYGLKTEQFPHAAECEDSSITLPIFPGMQQEDFDRVTDSLLAALREVC